MSDQEQLHPERINKVSARKFADLNGLEKLQFVGKVFVFLISAGFLFPTIFSE